MSRRMRTYVRGNFIAAGISVVTKAMEGGVRNYDKNCVRNYDKYLLQHHTHRNKSAKKTADLFAQFKKKQYLCSGF